MIFQIAKPRGRQQVEDISDPNLSSQSDGDSQNGAESAEEPEMEPDEEQSPPKAQPKGNLLADNSHECAGCRC